MGKVISMARSMASILITLVWAVATVPLSTHDPPSKP